MKQSKIQLSDLTLVRVRLALNQKYEEEELAQSPRNLQLQNAATIAKYPDYWTQGDNVDAYIKEHTYLVRLGIRTPPSENGYPYSFEIMFSGVIVNFDPADGNSDQLAAKYGLALLYGAIRDQIMGMTGKMKRGGLLLPTMSFEDETFDALSEAHVRMEANIEKRRLATQQAAET
jgi:hypothetical protein